MIRLKSQSRVELPPRQWKDVKLAPWHPRGFVWSRLNSQEGTIASELSSPEQPQAACWSTFSVTPAHSWIFTLWATSEKLAPRQLPFCSLRPHLHRLRKQPFPLSQTVYLSRRPDVPRSLGGLLLSCPSLCCGRRGSISEAEQAKYGSSRSAGQQNYWWAESKYTWDRQTLGKSVFELAC